MEYTAFLSYSQAADSLIARRLQTAVHRIAIPWYQKRMVNIFLDKTSLSANPGLWPGIRETLDSSKHFILLASRKAAKSEWVGRELSYWLGKEPQKKFRRLLLVLTDGDIVWNDKAGDFDWDRTDALPSVLSGVYKFEPLYVDLRWAKKRKYAHKEKLQFQDAIASLAAPLRGMQKDEIFNRETRLQKIAKRLVSYAATLLFALMIASGYLYYVANRRAEENRSLALASSARMVLGEGNSELAVALAFKGLQTSYPVKEAHKAMAEAAFFSAGTRRRFAAVGGGKDPITSVDVNRSGNLLLSGTEKGIVRLWSLESDEAIAQFVGHTAAITKVSFRPPDCNQFLSASLDGTMRIWDQSNQKEVRIFNAHVGGVTSSIFNKDGNKIVSGGKDHRVRKWDVQSGRIIQEKDLQQGEVSCLAISPKGRTIAIGTPDNTLWLWDSDEDTLSPRKKVGTWGITDLAFIAERGNRKENLLVGTGGYPDGINIKLIDTDRLNTITDYRGNSGGTCLSVLSNGTSFLSGTYDNVVRFWNVDDDMPLQRYLGHKDDVTDIAFFHNGKRFVTGSKDGTLRLWDLASPAEHATYDDQRGGPIALSPDGRTIISGHGKLSLWHIDSGEEPKYFCCLTRKVDYVECVAFSPDGTRAVTGMNDGKILVWDTANLKEEPAHLKIHLKRVVCAATANWPGGRTVVLSGSYHPNNNIGPPRNDLLLLWDLHTRKILRRLVGHKASIAAVAINKDGTKAVSGSNDKRIIVWDLFNGKPVHYLDGHLGKVTDVAFGPDDRLVLSTSDDQSVRLWNVETETEIQRYPGHTLAVTCIDFSPHLSKALNSPVIVTGSDDRTIRIWDLNTAEELVRLSDHTDKLRNVLFIPQQDNRLVSLNWDNTIRIWDISLPENLQQWTQENRYIRKFSAAEKRRYEIDD
jgi:WD40 repeat protein